MSAADPSRALKTGADSSTRQARRKLHVGHFALMRAVVQGLDVKSSWDRYLRIEGESSDARLVRTTIAWIRDEFAAAAKRHDRHGTARLVRLDATRIADPTAELPTLEAFALRAGLEDYSQAEQIEAYEAAYGTATARQKRRGRIIGRQLEALTWLQGLVAQPPHAGDAVEAWLNPTLATHLHQANIFTLAQLAERINGLGRRWHTGIAGLGPTKAARLTAWIREQSATTGLRIGAHVVGARQQLYARELTAVTAPATDIRPLEKFIVPSELDGSRGTYRRPQQHCLLKAGNDYQAILAWLRSKHGMTPDQKAQLKGRRRHRVLEGESPLDWMQTLSNTQRAYRKEAERFLLWAVLQKGRALSSMTNEDCVEYRDFLADPQPASQWCGMRSRERWSPLWRPFEGPLAAGAQRQAVTILRNLYGFLADQNYLMGNPWSAVSVPRSADPKVNAGRSLTMKQWRFVEGQLDQRGTHSTDRRLAFAMKLLYATGLRLSEAVAASLDDLRWVEYPADLNEADAVSGWMLTVVGKGGRVREVPVPAAVVEVLGDYLVSRGLGREVADLANAGAALLGKASDGSTRAPGLVRHAVDPREGIAGTTLYDQIKRFFAECGDVLRLQGDVRGAERFARASTHWLRHSHASHAIASGMPIEIAQQNLGHASLATTTVYVTTESKRRMKAVETFWNR